MEEVRGQTTPKFQKVEATTLASARGTKRADDISRVQKSGPFDRR